MQRVKFDEKLVELLPRLEGIAKRLDYDNHEDLLHDAIVSILERGSYSAVDGGSANDFLAWFTQVLKYTQIDRRRVSDSIEKKNRMLERDDEAYEIETMLYYRELLGVIWPKLRKETQDALWLYAIGGYSMRMIHRQLYPNMTWETFRSRIQLDLRKNTQGTIAELQ